MKTVTRTFARNFVTAALAVAAIGPRAAGAQTANDDAWRFQVILYGYLPDIGGTTNFPASGGGSGGPSINLDASTIFGHLQGVFMGMGEVSKGRWGVYTDVIYMDLGASKSGTREFGIGGQPIPADVTANLDSTLKGWVWTLAGRYRMAQHSQGNLDLLAGARLLDIEQTLGYQFNGDIGALPLPGRQGSVDVKLGNWDAIVGAKGRLLFGSDREWFIPYYVDVGTGQSRFTWQGIAGIGYSFKWGDLIAAWRYLDYNMKSDRKVDSLDFNGPALGVAFRW